MAIKKRVYLFYALLSLVLIFCSSSTYALKANGEQCSSWGHQPDGSYGPGNNECESGNCGVTDEYAVDLTYICCAKDPNYSHNDCCLINDDCDYPSMICKSPYYTCHWKCEYTPGGCCYKDSDCPSGYKCDTYADTEWQFGECKYVGGGGGTPSAYCGDGSCNGGETCSSCSSDCGSCETTTKANGEYCSLNYECDSGNCRNNICCTNGKLCCDDDNDCQQSCLGCWCSTSDHFCYEPQSQDACATVICKTGYKCVNGDCISTGTKGFCQSCSDGSDCASGACLSFSDGVSRCGSTTSTITCCGDGKGIENLQIGVDCCEDIGCDSEYKCVNYKCVLDLTTTPEKKVDGEMCFSNDECSSGWCDFYGKAELCKYEDCGNDAYDSSGKATKSGYCCSYGKKCCKIFNPELTDTCVYLVGEGYHCGNNFYCKKGVEEKAVVETGVGCPSGTCDVVEGCTHGEHPELRIEDCTLRSDPTLCKAQQEIIQKKCIENGAYGRLLRKDNSFCTYICCDGVIKDFGEAMYVPDCCTNADCEAGRECKGNYCVIKTLGRITDSFKSLFKLLESKCASHLQCGDDEFCSEEWECKKLVCSKCDYDKDHICSQCEYAKDHRCNRYQCCSDSECGVLQKCDTTIHKCFERSKCTKIIDNGDSNSKIDVAFIGDDYFLGEDFKGDVLKLVDYDGNNGYYGLMSVEPFKSEKGKFNIWIMEPEEDIPYKLNPWEPDPAKAREVAAKCPVSDYQIFVSKKSNYRSFCFFGGPCFLSLKNGEVDTNDYDGKVLVHEFAHGFGRIADEYVEEPMGNRPKEPNCVSDKAQAEKLWGDLVNTQSGYGYYEGCSYTKNNFRPTPTSIMRYPYTANSEFYLVNERFIQTRLDMYK